MAMFTYQLIRFGIVGLIATIIHVIIFVILIEFADWSGSASNLTAFFVAFFFSYFGHYFYSFKDRFVVTTTKKDVLYMPTFLKFCTVSAGGFFINALIAWGVVDSLQLDYWIAVVMMLTVTPITVFLFSKNWVFRQTAVAK